MAEVEIQVVDKRKDKIVRWIILTGWVFTLLAMIAILGAAVYQVMLGNDIPETLKNWGGIALGFLFGTFQTTIKDYVNE